MNPILILARLTIPLLILKYPLIGGAIAMYIDSIDWHTRYLFDLQPIGNYQNIDKLLDLYYLSLLAIVTRRFTDKLMRNIILGFFFYRLIGIILFEITGIRSLLFFFPNIFENLFFFYYIILKIAAYTPKLSYFALSVILVTVSIPKILEEYVFHIMNKPLNINFAESSLSYYGSWDQLSFLLILAILTGLHYKQKRKFANRKKEKINC